MNKHCLNTDLDRLQGHADDICSSNADVDSLDIDDQFCFAVYTAAHSIRKVYRPCLDSLGVTYPQYLVLMVLWVDDCQRVLDIGRRLHIDSGTLTPLLKRLEGIGLVKRRRRHEDEREVEISLTAQGRELRERAVGMREEVVERLRMPEADIAALRKSLMAIVETLSTGTGPLPLEAELRGEMHRSAGGKVMPFV